jgi:hypothetical protein
MADPHVFLSYRSEDRPARAQFERDGLAGMACGFLEIPVAGAVIDWQRVYQEMIADAAGIIVLVGARTADSKAVRWEIEEATRQRKPVAAVRIHNGPHDIPDGVPARRVLDWDVVKIKRELETWLHTAPTSTTVTTIWTGTRD